MKKSIKIFVSALLAIGSLTSCDKIFDSLEGDLSKMTAEDMLSSEAGILGILANLYGDIPMGAFSTGDRTTLYANASRSTPSYGTGGVTSFWNYTKMRSINKFIVSVEEAYNNGVISESDCKSYIAEAKFIRAYCYFAGVRVYGGLPIVTEPLDAKYGVDGNSGLYYERLTEKETWDWILNELTDVAKDLPAVQSNGELRANKYAALALKSRVALWAASESKYWDNVTLNSEYVAVKKKLTYMEPSYANDYYQQCIDASKEIIDSGVYSLYGADPANVSAAVNNLMDMFQTRQSCEWIFGKSYVSGSSTTGNGVEGWAPGQTTTGWLQGTGAITLNLIDQFDNYASDSDRSRADGTIITLADGGSEDYWLTDPCTTVVPSEYKKYSSIDEPFKLKDARFQAWIIYPDCEFRGQTIKIQAGMVFPDGTVSVYPTNNDGYEFTDGVTYYPFGGVADINSGFYRNNFDANSSCRYDYSFGIRKYLDPSGYNAYTQSPWYDMRYAEILLNYAEAVAESNLGDKALAKKCLNDVRHRAAFTDDVDLTVENVLHEDLVEFVYENHWSSILYRRRAFYDYESSENFESKGVKLTLLPMVDLSGKEAKYIFPRSVSYAGEPLRWSSYNKFQVTATGYYSSIPNYQDNHIDNNNQL